ncbi:VOC family protein [Actinophytocola sp.]|uniref:VOC family protein n=1 Tax=Actinophytocola sp. TaxID=1872138 RepID=UPI002ED0D4F6
MATRLNPYISFDGNARQAMEFYEQVFGGDLKLNTFSEFGGESDKIMHGMLDTRAGYTIMGADNPPDQPHQPGNNYSVSLSGDDTKELRGYWDKLNDGATVTVPLEKQMWGDEFGMLIDKFGVAWMVNITAPTAG